MYTTRNTIKALCIQQSLKGTHMFIALNTSLILITITYWTRRFSRLDISQGLRLVGRIVSGSLGPEILSVAIALLRSSAAANAGPEEEEEDGLAAPHGSKEAEQHPTYEPQAAGSWRVRAILPSVHLEKVVPELRVGVPRSIACDFPSTSTLHAHIQVVLHVIHYSSRFHLNCLHVTSSAAYRGISLLPILHCAA